MDTSSSTKRYRARLIRILVYMLAFLAIPTAVALVGTRSYLEHRNQTSPVFAAASRPPLHDPTKPTVAVVMSNVWTEITDFLGPYEILSRSGAYNVYAVAPERKLSSFNGVLDVMPHYSFAEFEQQGLEADIVVVPYMKPIDHPANASVLQWIRAQADAGKQILTICLGAQFAATAGVLDGHRATSYWIFLDRFGRDYPDTTWVKNARYVDDGKVVSSAGVTSGIDATLYLLKKRNGEAAAREVARQMDYPHTRFMDNPARDVPYTKRAFLPMGLYIAYRWDKPTQGVALYEGVGELELASVLDTYPSAATADAVTVAAARAPLTTAHGLTVVPRADFAQAPKLDRLIVPGANPPVSEALEAFAASRGLEPEALHLTPTEEARYPYDAVLNDIAEREGSAVTEVAGMRIEYPVDHLALEDVPSFPFFLVMRVVALGLLGVAIAWGIDTFTSRRRGDRAKRDTPRSDAAAS